jgi:kinetochore protein NDC80
MTLGGASSSVQKNRRLSLDVGDPVPGQRAHRPPRASMIPRVSGQENSHPRPQQRQFVPPSPTSSVNKPTASSSRRSSFAGPDRRRSLLPPSSSSASAKVDPRPINDKSFQHNCSKALLTFLQESGYDYPISTKTLARPSGKDFANIVSFLLGQVDPEFSKGNVKFEDEVAMNFKALGYPYPISKTALVAAGSPHTWPSLLAALHWLMEHLVIAKEARSEEMDETKPFESLEELSQKTDQAFFDYVGKAYTAYMANDEARSLYLEEEFAARFETYDNYLQQEVERFTDLNATIVERINALMGESQDLPTYAKKCEDYATDLQQFHDLIRQMDEHKAALELKIQERSTELVHTNAKLDKMNAHVKELKSVIATQELSVDEVRKMESEQKGVTEAMDRSLKLKRQREQALQHSRDELNTCVQKLDDAIATYNAKLADLASIPELGSKFAEIKAKLNKENLAEDQKDMLGVDLQAVVRPLIEISKAQYESKADQAKWDYQDALDQREKAEEDLQDAQAKLQILTDKYQRCEERLHLEKEAQDAKLAVRARELTSMEEKVASLRDPVALEEQMASYERQCAELEALAETHEAENVAKKRAVLEEIESAMALMAEHESFCRHKIAELDAYWQNKKDTGVLRVPDSVALE